jgi:hypothetical protein
MRRAVAACPGLLDALCEWAGMQGDDRALARASSNSPSPTRPSPLAFLHRLSPSASRRCRLLLCQWPRRGRGRRRRGFAPPCPARSGGDGARLPRGSDVRANAHSLEQPLPFAYSLDFPLGHCDL